MAIPSVRGAGFAMFDVLVALLLLAFTLTGACAALLQTLRTTHGSLLVTRAVDLAADLTESLYEVTSVTEARSVLEAWRTRVSVTLPVAGMRPGHFAELKPAAAGHAGDEDLTATFGHELVLRWTDSSRTSRRELKLPLATLFKEHVP